MNILADYWYFFLEHSVVLFIFVSNIYLQFGRIDTVVSQARSGILTAFDLCSFHVESL